MAKINQEEYEVLKSLEDEWNWIARDEDSSKSTFPNELWLYEYTPKKGIQDWLGGGGATERFSYDNDFQFIRWEDEEPYNIAELIEEYGSEETEVKRNLKEAILGIEVTQFDGQKADLEELVNPRQLEEVINDWMPEVLSQKWIDEHAKAVTYDGIPDQTEVVYVDDLQNLLVPKQEDLETKIQELIEIYKKEIEDAYSNPENFQIVGFIEDLKNLVEKEQKYYVLNSEGETMIRKSDSRVRTSSGFKIKNGFENENYKFTEQEIKDYDPRFWPFAVKVEELED